MKPKKTGKSAWKWISAALVLAGMVTYDNNVFCTKRYDFPIKNLPPQFENFRIVQLTDLHAKIYGAAHGELLAAVKDETPDAIFLTGDFVQGGKDVSDLMPLFMGLSQIAPAFFVTGNHEWSLSAAQREKLFSILERSGVIRLSDDYRVLRRGEEKLVIAGVDDQNGPQERKTPRELVRQIREEEGQDVCILMLCHRNTELPMWAHLKIGGVFCGHVHGGIVRLPLLGGVFGTERDFFPTYDRGLFTMNETTMLVSPGLGEHTSLPVRILNRPEVSVAILKR